mgnify:CR=1 FL=1
MLIFVIFFICLVISLIFVVGVSVLLDINKYDNDGVETTDYPHDYIVETTVYDTPPEVKPKRRYTRKPK